METTMKNNKPASDENQVSKNSPAQSAKRLASYTAAAGLGAFAFGENAQGVIIYNDVADIVVANGASYYIDMDGNGYDDFRFRHSASGYPGAAIRFQGVGYSYELTNTAKGSNYYMRSFELNDSIGPGAQTTSTGYGILRADYVNFGATDIVNYPQFAGILLDINGSIHYGWVRIQTGPVNENGEADPPITGTIFDWAYETDPNTAILAGDQGSFIQGDFDGDLDVDGDDLDQWFGDFGLNGDSDADIDGDSDGGDYLHWARNFTGPGVLASTTAVPEPTSLALLAAGVGAYALKRRK